LGLELLRKSINFCQKFRAPVLKPTLPLLTALVQKDTNFSPVISLCFFTEFPVWIFYGATALSGPALPNYRGFAITLRHTILIRTPLDAWSSHRRVPYVTTHNTHKRLTSMSAARFETAFPANKRLSTQTLSRAAAGMGPLWMLFT
jgi:hypothetical protein